MNPSTTRIWKKRIAAYDSGQPITKSLIYAFCKLCKTSIYGLNTDTKMDAYIRHRMDANLAWNITPEQTEQGLKWLQLKKVQKELNEKQKLITDNFLRFCFLTVEVYTRPHGIHICLPVYRIHSTFGAWFDYVAYPPTKTEKTIDVLS